MSRSFSEQEIREHDALFREAGRLAEGQLLLAGSVPGRRLGWFARRRLRRAVSLLERALEIAPDRWPTLWSLGKIHQRLGARRRGEEGRQHDEQADRHFARAHELAPTQPDVAREAAVAAMSVGDGPAAVRFARAATAAAPDDVGLLANLACAQLIDRSPQEALATATEALRRGPSDEITATLRRTIEDVLAGRREQPRTLRDLRAL